jgi:leucyl/phenylalanyl-tRNA---protein transferase
MLVLGSFSWAALCWNLPMQPTVPTLEDGHPLPDPRTATDGLVAVGGRMTVERLQEAYRAGIFPWTANPVTWWSPDPRAIFDLQQIHIPHRLRSAVRNHPYRVSVGTAFEQVMEACAEADRGDDDNWISEEFIAGYTAMHRAGFAQSFELWREDDLVAGIYGVALQGLFAGESMFHAESGASKIALVLLQQCLHKAGYVLFDTQMVTEVTGMLGAFEIPREEYLERLSAAMRVSPGPLDPSAISAKASPGRGRDRT